jgi:RNA methyltransferase, TrmH family
VLTNVRSERVRSLRGLSRRVARARAGQFLAEGPQAVRESVAEHARRTALGRPPLVREILAEPQAAARYAEVLSAARAAGILVTAAGPEVLAALSDTVHPQGLVAVCALIDVPLAEVIERRPPLVAVLSRVRDPGNAGTVLRAADAAGVDAVVLTDESVDVHNPKCVRASAGSVFHLPVVAGTPLTEAVAALKECGSVVLAADSRRDAENLDDLLDAAQAGGGPLVGPTVWLFGNEAWGLTDSDLSFVDHVVRVPIHGAAESLNLAAAAAVCLYASARAHRVR